jgi:hypothetical protein
LSAVPTYLLFARAASGRADLPTYLLRAQPPAAQTYLPTYLPTYGTDLRLPTVLTRLENEYDVLDLKTVSGRGFPTDPWVVQYTVGKVLTLATRMYLFFLCFICFVY